MNNKIKSVVITKKEYPISLASYLADNRSPFQNQQSQMFNHKERDFPGSLLYVQARRLFWLEEIIGEMVRRGVRRTWLALVFQMISLVCRMLAQVRRLEILQVGVIQLVRGSFPSLSRKFFTKRIVFFFSSIGSSSQGGTNVGAIVGGVIGSVAFILACVTLLWIFRRRQKKNKKTKKLPTDILDADDDDDGLPQNGRLPQNYQPEPFMIPIPDPTPSEFGGGGGGDELSTIGRPFSPGTRTSFYTRSDTPDLAASMGGIGGGGGGVNGESSGTGRKGGAPRPMRAVNIIQHQDAGPSNNGDNRGEEPVETIELPPAYTMVRGGGTGANSGGGDGPSTTADN